MMGSSRGRGTRGAALIGAVLATLVLGASSTSGQLRDVGDPGPSMARPPFGAGEKAEYQVRLGALSVGRGTMEILGIQNVSGHQTYHARLHVTGGIPLARVNTRMDTWIDARGLFSRRFEQDQNELRFRRHRIFDFYPESRSYRQRDNGETGRLPTDRPLDDVSFLYYVRTLPLRVGDSYTIPRYFKDDGNPVVINVVRRETVTVPAGTFETIVIQPVIQTDGLFGQGGRAEVFFTDDERRMLVQLRSRVPVVGSLSLHLQSYEPGTALPVTLQR